MDLTVTITGRRCDLALHPVSPKTVERIKALGRKFYTKKYIHWWRSGNTSTCGMKFDEECAVRVALDGKPLEFDTSGIPQSAVLLRRRHYLDSKARHLALLGYDDEYCHMTWTWTGLDSFDPARFEFFVHRWDRILGERDFLILDDVRYGGEFAAQQDWGGSCGFSLVDPRIIDLDEVRRELGIEAPAPAAKPAPKPRLAPVPAAAKAAPGPAAEAVPPCDSDAAPFTMAVAGANAHGLHGCTTCKNSIEVALRVEDDIIQAAGGVAAGCEYARRCLDALVRLVTGKTVTECWSLSNEDLHPLLDKVYSKLDCDTFTVGALKLALRDWEKKNAA
jgi:NifU-like protein involved in Fe-S cluster formation